jgi:hypothetical protein
VGEVALAVVVWNIAMTIGKQKVNYCLKRLFISCCLHRLDSFLDPITFSYKHATYTHLVHYFIVPEAV